MKLPQIVPGLRQSRFFCGAVAGTHGIKRKIGALWRGTPDRLRKNGAVWR